jgi:hypothetical protein
MSQTRPWLADFRAHGRSREDKLTQTAGATPLSEVLAALPPDRRENANELGRPVAAPDAPATPFGGVKPASTFAKTVAAKTPTPAVPPRQDGAPEEPAPSLPDAESGDAAPAPAEKSDAERPKPRFSFGKANAASAAKSDAESGDAAEKPKPGFSFGLPGDKTKFGFSKRTDGEGSAEGERPKPAFSFGRPKAADGEGKPKIGFTLPKPPAGGTQDSPGKPLSLGTRFQLPTPPKSGEGAKGFSFPGVGGAPKFTGFGSGFKPKE